MKKDVNTASILNLTASIGFYLASILFIIAAIIGKNSVYITVGVAFLCCGTLFLILSMRNGKIIEIRKTQVKIIQIQRRMRRKNERHTNL